ncbi:hypothetical protein HO173_010273 [Letharia columbiana]|uniref:Uncharacterized protein n=1 Tax=Letharia columbiana TaxID=112416 RepID=A0A8H6FMZ4_9LECA|nr:uncharacterized protein HO173_010273 [Letharia columbiana]KAF6231521.1 hypothetical protein HO173_010273 [Letharia columbiana]
MSHPDRLIRANSPDLGIGYYTGDSVKCPGQLIGAPDLVDRRSSARTVLRVTLAAQNSNNSGSLTRKPTTELLALSNHLKTLL